MTRAAKTPRFTQTIDMPVNVVYDSFTTATRLAEWFCYDAQLEVNEGGRFYAYWRDPKFYAMGEYLEVKPKERLSLKWTDLEGNTGTLEINFSELNEGTQVTAEYDAPIGSNLEDIWQRGMKALKVTTERGYHPNDLERPMLGVLVGATINAENAAQFNVPVTHGIAIQGALEGLSAAAAGLRRGDVLVSADGQDLKEAQTLPSITRAHKAGDTIEIVYYRDGERHAIPLELKSRPLHPAPVSLIDLAAQIEPRKAEVMRELDALVATFTEEEARFKPASNAWSANEVIAHLVNTERDTQTMIASLENGNELEVFTGNMDARVRATVNRYPSKAALVQALKDTHLETLEMIRNLPDHFLQRRFHVVRVQQNAEFDPAHTRQHFGQMQRAVDAARANTVPA
jgi:uncharacterized protein YndB with AHSA1/START domain